MNFSQFQKVGGGKIPSNMKEVMASTVPACMGGPVLADGDYACFRWLGNCSWEINYRGQVVLMDSYYDRGPRAPKTGVSADKVTRADAIVISHGHGDHVGDTVKVAKKTGAQMYGHQTVYDILEPLGLPVEQFRIFEDPDKNVIEFDGFRITMIHTLHNGRLRDSSGFAPAIETYTAPDEETRAAEAAVRFKGAKNRDIADYGLFSYYIEFESGFSVFASESNARGYSKAMREFSESRAEDIDVMFAPCQIGHDPNIDIYEKKLIDLVEDLKPHLVMPQHHDLFPNFPMSSMVPLFQWIYDNHPDDMRGYLQLYREPIVFDTVGQHGQKPLRPITNY